MKHASTIFQFAVLGILLLSLSYATFQFARWVHWKVSYEAYVTHLVHAELDRRGCVAPEE